MLIKVDKFFIAELQRRGFNLDYKEMVDIYKASRQHPGYIARKKRQAEEEELMMKLAEYVED